jgi:hypothetical protein
VPSNDEWHRGFAEPDLGDRYPPSATPPPKSDYDGFEGVDDAGVISVTVDRSGAVADVLVPRDWRDRIGPRELDHALLTATNNALNSWLADLIEHTDFEPKPAPTARPDAVADPVADPASEAVQNSVTETLEVLATFERDLDVYREQLEKAVHTTATAQGSNGRIHVAMASGKVTQVTVDPRWATSARYTEIRAEALGAFHAAGRQLGAADPSKVRLPASLARLRELDALS